MRQKRGLGIQPKTITNKDPDGLACLIAIASGMDRGPGAGGDIQPVVGFAMSPLATARFAKGGRRQLSELAPIDLGETPEMGEAV